ncbi:hydroxyacid dehydrogenase [Promethearchaeum syntrophicum]|uniref:Hydroxyacid dehydrogenase n=1 Tax=Promethearchaeum syntrophicum TaxID=2594042 RepID=A0A5B9D5U2_9ARCH|nr:hydroxyacid dehydrogenase [Candidatus Prometheoarchaeum syntrophicum]QEE14346.1 Glyoxylate reductase [Candidatus Prometheoarchaeum syntrophicum]
MSDKKFKILVADNCSKSGLDEGLETYNNIQIDIRTKHTEEELIEMIPEYDAMIVRSATKVTAPVIEAATNLKIIARAGAGYNNIDVEVCNKKGIAVIITPTGNTNAVIELTLGLMLSWVRHISIANQSMKDGKWEKKKLKGSELKGKTLGILGIGRIGAGVSKICQAFEMKTIAYDVFVSKEYAKSIGVDLYEDFNEFLSEVDFLSLHVPVTDSTRGMIGKEQFEIMKDTAVIVNCARGAVINEKELYDALSNKKIGGACIDVYSKEPASKEDFPYIGLDNVVCTPHLGASSKEAQVNVAMLAANGIAQYLNDNKLINCVNEKSIK